LSGVKGVLIVDDHPGFRAQARRLLEREGFRIVGEAGDCATAITAAAELAPALVLVDVYLPDGDGFALAERIAGLADPPAVILISSHDESELEPAVGESSARGFIAKAELSREAIRKVLE
jgi:DNA-binding NarL/FixJ family response regulator